MLDRRRFFSAAAFATVATVPASARADRASGTAGMRGTIDAAGYDLEPDAAGDQSAAFQAMLDEAAAAGRPVVLPAGRYMVSGIRLPSGTSIIGVPGLTRIVQAGDGALLTAEEADVVALRGLVIDGAWRPVSGAGALLSMRGVGRLVLEDCRITASAGSGVALERTRGHVRGCDIVDCGDVGLYSVEAGGLAIENNSVSDCANGGILVHRWQAGEDSTIVAGNRVARIAARNGGTGQFGNGINLYRAANVVVRNNHVADCAFSAIRANGASNVAIGGNTCLRSGETAIYAEFAFEGASITDNIVDGAANGISIVNFNEGGRLAVCSGNLVRNLSTTGPYPSDPPGFGTGIAVEADTTVTGNTIENAPLFGLHLGWGPFLRNVVATGNMIRDVGEGIAVSVVEGAGAALITGNLIAGARHGAIIGHRWSERATGDLAGGEAALPANLSVERNLVG